MNWSTALIFILFSTILCQNQLQLGIPYTGTVPKDQFVQFELPLSQFPPIGNDDYLVVMLSPLSGDSDLYVHPQQPPSRPCPTCLKSKGPGGDFVELQRSDSRWPTQPGAKFYIGVYGVESARFRLNTWVTGSRSTHIQLANGETQTAITKSPKFTYFSYFHGGHEDFTISVSTYGTAGGDPDIYVSHSTMTPTETDYIWKQIQFGSDWLTITTDDPQFKAFTTYYIGVRAFIDAYYTISATSKSNYTLLLEGSPSDGEALKSTYQYYKFYSLSRAGDPDLLITVTAKYGVGDPDMYVVHTPTETPPATRPGRENFQWASLAPGEDTLRIPKARDGWYWIAVYGWTDVVYHIVATSSYASVQLRSGVSQIGYVDTNDWIYYSYHANDEESGLTFTVTPRGGSGSFDAYVLKGERGTRPGEDPEKHDWKLSPIGNSKYLYLPPPVSIDDYYIGVKGIIGGNFTILAATNQSATYLRDGVAVTWNYVPRGVYRYFVFEVPKMPNDIIISLTSLTGDADLYVSQFPWPTTSNYTWFSFRTRQDTVIINKADPKLKPGTTFYISVYGFSTTSYFQIIAFTSESSQPLNDGTPQPGAVKGPEDGKVTYTYYRFDIPDPSPGYAYVSITLEITSGESTDASIYVSGNNRRPTAEDNEWSSANTGDDFVKIEQGRYATYYIGVRGDLGSLVSYIITARANYQYILPNANSFPEWAKAPTLRRFVFNVDAHDRDDPRMTHMVISCTLVSGKTKLYVSNNASRPAGPNYYQWVSDTWPGNTILIPKQHPNFQTGLWSFAVEAIESSDFYVSVTTSEGYLDGGRPRLGRTSERARSVYKYDITDLSRDYYLNIRVISGSISVYVGQDDVPSPSNFTFASVLKGTRSRVMVLKKEGLRYGFIRFSVYSDVMDSVFELTITPQNEPKLLIQDQPHIQYSVPFNYTYFTMLNFQRVRQVVDIFAETCDNNRPPRMYFSELTTKPTSRNYTAVSREISRFRSTVKASVPEGYAKYYLGVTSGELYNYFSIYATTGKDLRPIVTDSEFRLKSYKERSLEIIVPTAKSQLRGTNLVYDFFLRTLTSKEDVNMFTSCGIMLNAEYVGSYTDVLTPPEISFTFTNIDSSKFYLVNVLVHDNYGLSSPYQPMWVVNGQLYPYDRFPGTFAYFPFSVGAVFIILVTVAITIYMIVGMIYNSTKGARGIRVIPHFEFWSNFIYYVWDGIKFVFTCGRASSYYKFTDENESVSTTLEITSHPKQPKQPVESEEQSTAGYGTI